MAVKLLVLSVFGSLTGANLVASSIAMVLGAFAATSPRRAAEIWGSQRLRASAQERRLLIVRWYRVFGLLLFLAGVLFAIDSILFPK